MSEAVVTLKKGGGRTLKQGGPWIYDNEVDTVLGTFEDGDMVLVHDFDGYPLGRGFINRNSKLMVRMMTRDRDTQVDEAFLRMRVKKKVMDDISSCRVIFGEADFLPGLVIDKFADVLVVESLALGIDRFKVIIVDILKELMEADGIHIRGVYERSDAKVREQEGMWSASRASSANLLIPRLRSWRTACATTWMSKMGKKQDSSWIRNTTAARRRNFAKEPGYWTALPILAPSPSMPGWPGRSTCWAWTHPNWAWHRQEKMRN